MGRNAVVRQCGARGCRRKTKAKHGYCWQHEDMAEVAQRKWPEDKDDDGSDKKSIA